MLYAQVTNGKNSAILRWPLSTKQLRALVSNVSLPSDDAALEDMDLEHLNIFKVPERAPPEPTLPMSRMILAPPTWEAGELVRQFQEEAYSQDQVDEAWASLRARRNNNLRATDWSQSVADIDADTKAAFATYRQALRDLPENTTDPFKVEWPAAPGAE
jgi:hypothetical protein